MVKTLVRFTKKNVFSNIRNVIFCDYILKIDNKNDRIFVSYSHREAKNGE